MFEILEKVCTPKKGTKYSAYIDLFAREDVVIGVGETKIVKLGVKLKIEYLLYELDYIKIHHNGEVTQVENEVIEKFLRSHYLEVAIRSSLAVKGLVIANGIGIIDLDYPDEIGLIVHNPISTDYVECESRVMLAGYEAMKNKLDITEAQKLIATPYLDKLTFKISKGDKVAQCTLKEHKGYLMGYESDVVRKGGFGSTGN